jgi:hypothetical protein
MSGKVKHCGSGHLVPDRSEGGPSAFEHVRGMKAMGNGVRFLSHIGKRNEASGRR